MSVYFLSHESPTMWDTPSAARQSIIDLGASLPRPKAVVVVTPHWLTKVPFVSSGRSPETIHDFGGFPEHYYKVRYPAPGASELAGSIASALQVAGIECEQMERGFDHATWQVCGLMWPQADIPITQLSIQMHRSPEEHFKIGEALKALVKNPDIMLIATGTWTHNLGEFFSGEPLDIHAKPAAYAVEFSEWMHERVRRFQVDELFQFRKTAPHAYRAHPTPDHILGLFVAMGAATSHAPQILHHSFVYGSLAMTHIRFE